MPHDVGLVSLLGATRFGTHVGACQAIFCPNAPSSLQTFGGNTTCLSLYCGRNQTEMCKMSGQAIPRANAPRSPPSPYIRRPTGKKRFDRLALHVLLHCLLCVCVCSRATCSACPLAHLALHVLLHCLLCVCSRATCSEHVL